MALEVAHAVEERLSAASGSHVMTKLILVHPFLAVTPDNSDQRALGLLTELPVLMALLSAAIGALPAPLKHSVVKACAGKYSETISCIPA